jgi:hypothetical protein
MQKKILITASALLATFLAWQWWSLSQRVDYATEVKPLLNSKCISCHGGVKKSGGFSLLTREEALMPTKSGKTAIVPGDAGSSEMIRRLTCADADERMPYKEEPLTPDQVALLERWVDQGAEWEVHWAYKPLADVAIPGQGTLWGSSSGKWGNNPIDAFVLDRLDKENLQPSPEADKITLIRRASIDLIGLPPTEAQVQAFLADSLPDAYERLVDTLLASPRYGERWTAMWLDLARYADSKGYERDDVRSAWRYRDWLIEAFNNDTPYDRFLTEQLAGDLLPNPTDAQYIATTFHRNTPTNDEGGTDNEEFRTAAVLDRVNTTWEALMGTSFSCIQCHSHPYDPIFHEEYYQFAAFFNNTRDFDTYDDYPQLRHLAGKDSLQLIELRNWLDQNTNPLERERIVKLVKLWQPAIYSIEVDSMVNSDLLDTKFLGFSHPSSARLQQVELTDRTHILYKNSTMVPGGKVEIRLDSTNGPLLVSLPVVANQDGQYVKYLPIKPTTGKHDLYLCYTNPALRSKPDAFGVQYDWFSFVPDFPGKGKPGQVEQFANFMALMNASCDRTPVMAENPDFMFRSTHVFERGNWLVHGKEVSPKTPAHFPSMPAGAPMNRLGLAQWLTAKGHPLTARVMVNRLWEQMFGIGIVETVEDFGSQGATPSHPELLDWLAYQFINDQGWSMKKMLRLITTSATYRQSSHVTPELQERDPQNRLMARGSKVRLSAEQIRDQALVASGLLMTKMYGKPVMPYQPDGIWHTPWNDNQWHNATGDNAYRRTLYTYWKRSSPYPSSMTFDGAGRLLCTSRRIRTNTPLQALVTLNDPVYLECAKHLAIKMTNGNADNADNALAALQKGYLAVTGRALTPERAQVLEKLFAESLQYYKARPQETSDLLHDLACERHDAHLAAMTVVANALLNLDEAVTRS